MILKIDEFVTKINDYSHAIKPNSFLKNICVLLTIRLLNSNTILQKNIETYINKIYKIVDMSIHKFILYISDAMLRIYSLQSSLSFIYCNPIKTNIFDIGSNSLDNIVYTVITSFIYNYIVEHISTFETKFDSLVKTNSENSQTNNLLQELNDLDIDIRFKMLYKIYYVLMISDDAMNELIHSVFDTSLEFFYNKLLPTNIVNINIDKALISDSILVSFKFKIDYIGSELNRNIIKTELSNMLLNENKASRQSIKPKTSAFGNYNSYTSDYNAYTNFFNMNHTSVMNRYCVNCNDCSSCFCCYNCSKCFMCSYCTFIKKSIMSMFVNRSIHINHCYGVNNGLVNQYCNNVDSCRNCTRLNNSKNCFNVRDSAWLDNVLSYKHVYGTRDNYLTLDEIHDSNIYTISNMLRADDSKSSKSATKLSINEYEDLERKTMIETHNCLI